LYGGSVKPALFLHFLSAVILTWMLRFVKNIDAHDFTFNRIYTVSGVKYHVPVHNHLAAYYFMMEFEHKWVISGSNAVPPWIKALEDKLHKALSDHRE
jgi:hypothetical protein